MLLSTSWQKYTTWPKGLNAADCSSSPSRWALPPRPNAGWSASPATPAVGDPCPLKGLRNPPEVKATSFQSRVCAPGRCVAQQLPLLFKPNYCWHRWGLIVSHGLGAYAGHRSGTSIQGRLRWFSEPCPQFETGISERTTATTARCAKEPDKHNGCFRIFISKFPAQNVLLILPEHSRELSDC